jgi:putative spermidine/putrescine transport system substrate-binding protein
MGKTEISRRRFLKMTGLTAAAAGAASVAFPHVITTAKGAANELVFVGFGGGYQEGQTKALFEPFEKETGIKVVQTTGVDLAKLRAQVQSKNVEWDLISIPDRLRYTAVQDGLLQKLNYGMINAKDIQKDLVTEHAVGCVTIPMLLTYSTKAHPPGKEPKTWMDYWDPAKVPGIRGMYNAPPYSLEFALIADGVPKDKLYPLDVTRAFKSFDRIKPAVKVWWSQFPQPGVLLQSGEITMTPWTRSITPVFEGQPMGVSYDGAALTYEGWVVPTGAPNAQNAMKFINWALQPKPQAELTKYVAFGPTNKNATQFVNPKLRPLLSSDPENVKKGFLLSGDWWGPNLEKVTEAWNEWRLK